MKKIRFCDYIVRWLALSTKFYGIRRLSIPISTPLLRPTISELQGELPWVRGVRCDSSPTTSVTFKLRTVFSFLERDDALINVEEFERRISPKRKRGRVLGFQHGLWLMVEQNRFPKLRELEGKFNILLPGLTVVDSSGDRRMFFLDSGGKGWWMSWRILNHRTGFSPRDLIAYSG